MSSPVRPNDRGAFFPRRRLWTSPNSPSRSRRAPRHRKRSSSASGPRATARRTRSRLAPRASRARPGGGGFGARISAGAARLKYRARGTATRARRDRPSRRRTSRPCARRSSRSTAPRNSCSCASLRHPLARSTCAELPIAGSLLRKKIHFSSFENLDRESTSPSGSFAVPIACRETSSLFARFRHPRFDRLSFCRSEPASLPVFFAEPTEPILFLALASSPGTEHRHNARAWPWRRRRRPVRAPSRPYTSCGLVRASEPQVWVDARPSTKPNARSGAHAEVPRSARRSTFRFLAAEGRLKVGLRREGRGGRRARWTRTSATRWSRRSGR